METWNTLREFIKKYGTSTTSWRSHTAFEVDKFQNYDALDFRAYFTLKTSGKREEEESIYTGNGITECSSEIKSPKSTGNESTITSKSSKIKSKFKTALTLGMKNKNSMTASHQGRNGRTVEKAKSILDNDKNVISS